MQRNELKELFNKYLYRDFDEDEWTRHGHKNYNNFITELLNCEEYKRLHSVANLSKLSNKKLAILLTGHIRKGNIIGQLNEITKVYDCDVFIHTWDNFGNKGSETNVDDKLNGESIENIIKKINNVKYYVIENNKTFISSIKDETLKNTYFNYSSDEVFIKSQLYSINTCFNIMKEYSIKNNVNYDCVFKFRFDNEIAFFNFTEELAQDIINYDIIFVPNKDCGHHHPDSDGTSCIACDKMYYKHKLKHVHIFDHINVICDIFAYGNINSMEKYCSLFKYYDELNQNFLQTNLVKKEKIKTKISKKGNTYTLMDKKDLGHIESLYYFNCSYPERLLQIFLKDYMLVESRLIKLKFKR